MYETAATSAAETGVSGGVEAEEDRGRAALEEGAARTGAERPADTACLDGSEAWGACLSKAASDGRPWVGTWLPAAAGIGEIAATTMPAIAAERQSNGVGHRDFAMP
jgi:hypothetical protein